MNPEEATLLFVYNANSGMLNTIIDGAHKVLSPKTYACNLCDITYGMFAENKVWKKFRESNTLTFDFLYKDEFLQQYASKFGHAYNFPIVLIKNKGDLEVFIASKELNTLKTAQELIAVIEERL